MWVYPLIRGTPPMLQALSKSAKERNVDAHDDLMLDNTYSSHILSGKDALHTRVGPSGHILAKGDDTMIGVKMIHHVNVQISNRQRTREWYEQVLGAEFLDRGPLNERQLQLRIGTGEMHFTETSEPVATGHFAVEVDNWDEMLANLERLGIPYTRAPGATHAGPPRTSEDTPYQGRREDN